MKYRVTCEGDAATHVIEAVSAEEAARLYPRHARDIWDRTLRITVVGPDGVATQWGAYLEVHVVSALVPLPQAEAAELLSRLPRRTKRVKWGE